MANLALEVNLGGSVFLIHGLVEHEWHWVRFDKALTPEQAEEMFKHFSRIAPTHGYRRVQIRHGRDEVVKEWTAPAHGHR